MPVRNSLLLTSLKSRRTGWRAIGIKLASLRESERAQASLRNALYGAGEYVALPLMMLLATPFLLHHLGVTQFGVWMLASAAVTSSSLISSGFGDAALKYASLYRRSNRTRLENTLRVTLTINLMLGGVLAILLWYGSPYAVHTVFKIDIALRSDAIIAFRIGSAILILRCFESVLVGALRAHERYGPSVQISIISRAVIVVSACALVLRGYGIVAIMAATFCTVGASVIAQTMVVRVVVGPLCLLPSINRAALSEVSNFGCFSWLQAVAGCIFNQADRLLVGALLGASSVSYYSVCVQAAQPIHGLIAAGLHFLFPHLSARLSAESSAELRSLVRSIFCLNAVAAAALCIPLVLFSKYILHLWMGATFARQVWMVLSIIALGFGFLALNITAHYTLLALAQVRLVAMLNLLGGAAMLIGMTLLAPRFGLAGAAIGRLLYGPITLLMYRRLHRMLSPSSPGPTAAFAQMAVSAPESR